MIDYHSRDFTQVGGRWDRILDMVATRTPSQIAKALSKGASIRHWVVIAEFLFHWSLAVCDTGCRRSQLQCYWCPLGES